MLLVDEIAREVRKEGPAVLIMHLDFGRAHKLLPTYVYRLCVLLATVGS